MSQRSPLLLAAVTLWALAQPLGAARVDAAAPSGGAQLESYAKPKGPSYFALSLKPEVPPPAVGAHQIVVLFDTSASQTGAVREKALAALDALLAALPAADRVQLMACDVNAVPMTNGFVAPGSNDLRAAMAQLNRRVPLGSTDMSGVLQTAAQKFTPGANPRAVIYIGDGMSIGDQLSADDMQSLVNRLVKLRVPVSSYAIGPRTDNNLLGALANHTGGMVHIDTPAVDTDQIGRQLSTDAHGTVYWPTAAQWPASFGEVFPKTIPPLRSDRDMLLLGVGSSNQPVDVQISVEVGGQAVDLLWNVKPAQPSDDNAFLGKLVDAVRPSGGIGLSMVGMAGLKQARLMASQAAHEFNKLGVQAMASGNAQKAVQLAQGVLALDPNNPDALAVMRMAGLRMARKQPAAGSPLPNPGGDEGLLLDEFDKKRQVIAQKMEADVLNAIEEARRTMSRDPEVAKDQLKIYQENVRRAPELDPDVRARLLDRLAGALQQVGAIEPVITNRIIEQQRQLAIREERRRMLGDLERREQKLDALMSRFDSLMNEGRYFDAESVADLARELAPERAATTAAVLNATQTGYAVDSANLKLARERGMVDTLRTVEASHIPFPDEPPIVYPDKEFWQALTERRKEFARVSLDKDSPAEQRIIKELENQTILEFVETPLQDVIDYLKEYHKIEIQLDKKSLDDEGIGTDTPVSRNLRGISLKSALRLLLRDLALTYIIEDEVLLITTKTVADTKLSTKVYPVADLVLPIDPMSLLGGIGGIGGQGGFGGGQGGGQGGGGQGFGGGGGQQGGGGGGFFAVEAEKLPASPDRKPGDLKLPAKKLDQPAAAPVPKPAPLPTKAAARRPSKIEFDLQPGVSPEVHWNDYFARQTERVPEGSVRETVRQLMHGKKYDHVVGLINAALRNHQAQPWMYEALGLAMQANNSSLEEVERALLSAVDFSRNTTDLMYVALYMSRAGLPQRALKLFQQAAKLEPTRPEPYIQGLALAQDLKDVEGIKWSTVGVLKQAWPKEQAQIWNNAHRAATAMLQQLRTENRNDEAELFESALNDSLRRDCVVVVSWTGDADVDLLVEEPTGTICSFRNPRTPSGGVMLGDTFARADRTSDGGFSEIYACPLGFDGTYRLLLRRVWGKPTAGRVMVDIYTHYNSDRNQRLRKVITLGAEEAVVTFDLADGRRRDALEDHQLAQAAQEQIAVRREILAQQIGGLAGGAGGSASGSFNASRNRPFVVGNRPFGRPGAVGFQPVIITLPEGASLNATAVVSADRRYVRITAIPFFSGISEVNVFNTSTGAGGQTGGGTGGQGFSGGGQQGQGFGGGGQGGGGQGGFGGGQQGGGGGGFGGGGGGGGQGLGGGGVGAF